MASFKEYEELTLTVIDEKGEAVDTEVFDAGARNWRMWMLLDWKEREVVRIKRRSVFCL